MSDQRTHWIRPVRVRVTMYTAWTLTGLLVVGSAAEMWHHRVLLWEHPEIALLDLAYLLLLWWYVVRPLHGATVEDAVRAAAAMRDSPEGLITVSSRGEIESVNPAAQRIFGLTAGELVSLPIGRFLPEVPLPAAHRLSDIKPAESGIIVQLETEGVRPDGRRQPVDVRVCAVHGVRRFSFLWIIRDIRTQRRWADLQALLHEIDRRILKADPMEESLRYLCAEMVRLFELPLAFVALREDVGHVRLCASAGEASGFLEGVPIRWDDSPQGRGVTGKAIRTGEFQRQVTAHPDAAAWRERAASYGVTEALSVPLVVGTEVLGALTLYARAAGIDPETTQHLLSLADQVSVSIVAARGAEQIRVHTAALEAAANAVVITDRTGRIIFVNSAWEELTGYSPTEVLGKTPGVLRSGHHTEQFYHRMWETILAGHTWQGQVFNRRKDGSFYIDEQTITPVRGATGEVTHFIAIKQDVTDRKRHEDHLRHLALHDPLTELPNRRALKGWLEDMVNRCRSGLTSPGALLFLDLDNFKTVNDSLGHAAGDDVLVELSHALRRTLRPSDFLCRLGGDEFAVLLENVSPGEAQVVAERLRHAVTQSHFQTLGLSFEIGVSIGLAPINGEADPDLVLSLSDSAMYAAKGAGKNRLVIFHAEDHQETGRHQNGVWVSRVRNALRDDRFLLHFQPVVRLADGRVDHQEALLRMRSETGDLVYPATFLTVAERHGLMPDIDRWVIGSVLSTLKTNPEMRIFVNLSGYSLNNESLLAWIEVQVRSAQIEPGHLTFEITESAVVQDVLLARRFMLRLKGLGCTFALDDFGIGFSSFGYLRDLPADWVKIDGSFIQNLGQDADSLPLVTAINAVARAMGKQVIAEWVESEQTKAHLMDLGIEYGQGYLCGRPVPLAHAAAEPHSTAPTP